MQQIIEYFNFQIMRDLHFPQILGCAYRMLIFLSTKMFLKVWENHPHYQEIVYILYSHSL